MSLPGCPPTLRKSQFPKDYTPNKRVQGGVAKLVTVETALRNSGTATQLDWMDRVRGKIHTIEFEREFKDFSGSPMLDASFGSGSDSNGAGGQGGSLHEVFERRSLA